MELSEERTTTSKNEDTASAESLQALLADYRAQVEHWQGVATICELSKQEELAELQKKCDQEMQSLQEALRETAEQYEAQICALQSEASAWRRGSGQAQAGGRKGRKEAAGAAAAGREDDPPGPLVATAPPSDLEAAARPLGEAEGLAGPGEGYFSQHCDTASLSSFSCLDTPSLSRRPPPQEDTASLVSTGTLVPEAIYLPPAGHRLVTHGDWDALNAQVSELQGEVSRLETEREELEKELDTQTNHTHKQVALLQSQVQSSETLLQEVQKSFSQSQNAVQSRLAELSLSQRKVCSELSKLKGEEQEEDEALDSSTFPATLQGAHCEERLRIEIVNLKDQLDRSTEENEVLEVQLSSLKTETERVQTHRDKLEADLLSCRTELQALRVALSHLQSDNKALSNDKVVLQRQCLELRSQGISLRSQVETSHTVQRDFVQLSQSLQVKLEQIRQADSLDHVKEILGERPSEDSSPPNDAT